MSEEAPVEVDTNPEEEVGVNSVNVETPSAELPESATANGDNGVSRTSDSDIAKGISSIISTVIKDFDFRAEETICSQDQLSLSIDRFTRELDQLLEDAPLPFIMQHAARISGVRKRVSSLNTVLKSIQRRVDNIDRIVSAGLSREKDGDDGKGAGQGSTVGLMEDT